MEVFVFWSSSLINKFPNLVDKWYQYQSLINPGSINHFVYLDDWDYFQFECLSASLGRTWGMPQRTALKFFSSSSLKISYWWLPSFSNWVIIRRPSTLVKWTCIPSRFMTQCLICSERTMGGPFGFLTMVGVILVNVEGAGEACSSASLFVRMSATVLLLLHLASFFGIGVTVSVTVNRQYGDDFHVMIRFLSRLYLNSQILGVGSCLTS